MGSHFIDPKKVEEAHRLIAEGCNNTEIERRVGISRGTVAKLRGVNPAKADPVVPPKAMEEMRKAAEVNDYAEFEDPARLWSRAEREANYNIKKAVTAADFSWAAPGNHVLISFLSDQHIAPGTPVDFKAMREDAELIAKTPNAYAVFGGDCVDNHLKHRAAIIHARSTPKDQYLLFEYYLQIFADRAIAMVSGNHDDWTSQFAGVDMLARIAKDKRIFYNPDEAYIDLRVGSQKYVVGVRHQYNLNSRFNQTHAPKQWMRLGIRDFDVGVVCHHHEAAIEQTLYRGTFRWLCRPGSYQITSAYSRQYGWNQATPTSPTFLFCGNSREIYGWNSLKAAVECVKAMRELGV